MRKIRTALVLALAPAVCPPSVLRAADEKLVWLDAPATHFTESLPLGNGRLGAVVFGGVAEERIVLNETGLWSGSPGRSFSAGYYPAQLPLLLAQGCFTFFAF